MADNPYEALANRLFNGDAVDPEAAAASEQARAVPKPAPVQDNIPSPAATPAPSFQPMTPEDTDPNITLRQSVIQGMDYDPDQAAKARPIAEANKIPLDMAVRTAPEMQKQIDFDHVDFDTLQRDYPKLAEFFRDPNNAAVAHDDIPALERVEDTGKAIYYGLWGSVANILGGGALFLQQTAGSDQDNVISQWVAQESASLRKEVTGPAAEFASENMPQGAHKNLLTEAIGALAGMIPALAAPEATPGMFYAQSSDVAQTEAEKAGATPAQQTEAAVGEGAVGALSAELKILPVLNKIPAFQQMVEAVPAAIRNSWFQKIAQNMAVQKGTELSARAASFAVVNAAQQFLNNLIEHFTYNPNKEVTEGVGRAAEVGGLSGAIMHSIAMALTERGRLPAETEEPPPAALETALNNVSQNVRDSKLYARDPETFHRLMQKLYPDKMFYIPVEEGLKFFQGSDDKVKEDLAKNVPELANRASESVETGADIPVPMADYLTWIAPHDNGTLAKTVRLDPAHGPVDVLEMYPELSKMVPKEEPHNEAARAFETRITREAVAGGLSQHEAETWAAGMREAYETLTERDENAAGEFDRLGVRDQNPVEGVSDQGMDYAIGAMKRHIKDRQRASAAKAERAAEKAKPKAGDQMEMGNLGAKEKKQRAAAGPTPIINYLADHGKVMRGSMAAKELHAMGITGETHPRLFSTKGKFKDIDNIPVTELNDRLEELNTVAPDDGHGYADPRWLYDQMREEAHGRGIAHPEDVVRDERTQYLEKFEGYLRGLGVDPESATKAEIKSAIAKARAGGDTLYQGATPLTEKQFYRQYVQHIDLRGRESGNADETAAKILEEGFRKGANVNAVPPWRGGEPKDIGDEKFMTRAGDVVYLAPKEAWKDAPNGPEIQDGWKPKPWEVIKITDPKKSMYENYKEAFEKHNAGKTFEQGGNRGSITFTPDGRSLIDLFANRDKSTILHEAGHFFLNVLRNSQAPGLRDLFEKTRGWWLENHGDVYNEAKRYNPYQVREVPAGYHAVMFDGKEEGAFDTAKAAQEFADQKHAEALKELQARGGKDYVKRFIESGMGGDIDHVDRMVLTAMDEQFARGHEAYLLEGKAPSEAVRGVFRRFTAWLAKIYGSVKKLNVNMSPEIRDVFDRIYASDDAIESTKNITAFKPDPAVMEMMTKDQQESYLKQQRAREDQAREATVRRALRDADRTTKDWWKSETSAKEDALRGRYLQEPAYAASEAIKAAEDGRLDRKVVEDRYGPEVAKAMDKKLFGGKSDPDLIADRHGYDSGDDLVTALTRLPDLAKRVKEEARAQMVQEHGDVFLNGQLEEVAIRNMLSSHAEGMIEKEMAAGNKEGGPVPSGKDFRRAAAAALEKMPVEAAKKPSRFLAGMVKMARAASKALTQKDYEAYADAKRREMFALNMFRETRDFQDEHEKAIDYFNRIMQKPKRQTPTVDPQFRRAAWGVLSNFMATPEPKRSLQDIRDLISQNISSEYDTPVQIPPAAETAWGKAAFKNMTVDEFRAVRDVVAGLMHFGQRKQSAFLDGKRIDFSALMGQIVPKVAEEVNDRRAWSRNAFQKVSDQVMSTLVQTDFYLEQIDKGDKTGTAQWAIKRPIDLGRSTEIDRSKQVYRDVHDIFTSSFTKKELREMSGVLGNFDVKKTLINGRTFTREERLAYLLNSGNDGNKEAVDTGMGWDQAARDNMMRTFTKKDYDFAQKVWNYLDSYWKEISALEEKRYGWAPEKVEATELDTPFGKYRGGYYPIKWDVSKNQKAQEFELEREMKGYIGYASTATKRGHTFERVGANKFDRMPVDLSFNPIMSHLQNVIHDLSMGEAIQQSAKIIRNVAFKNAFIDRFGSDAYSAMDLWLKDVASGPVRAGSWIGMADQWARRNAQVATMALNSTTIMSHPGRLMNSVEGLGGGVQGAKWLGRGFKEQFAAMRSPDDYRALLDKINAKSGLMKSRVDTMSREMMDAKQAYSKDPLDTHSYRRALLAPIALMQVHAVDVSTWLGAYHQALEEGKARFEEDPIAKDREAVFYADQVVKKYQGSGLMEDMSGLLRGTLSNDTRQNPMVKTLTFAHSFFNNKLNRLYSATKLADLSTWAGRYRYARTIVTVSFMDALITDLLLNRLPGQMGEDDQKKVAEGWGWWLGNRALELVPLLRDAERWYHGDDTGGPPQEVAKAIHDTFTSVGKDKEDRKELEAVITGVGMTTGMLPAVELNRLIDLINRANSAQPVEYKDFVRTRRKNEK